MKYFNIKLKVFIYFFRKLYIMYFLMPNFILKYCISIETNKYSPNYSANVCYYA